MSDQNKPGKPAPQMRVKVHAELAKRVAAWAEMKHGKMSPSAAVSVFIREALPGMIRKAALEAATGEMPDLDTVDVILGPGGAIIGPAKPADPAAESFERGARGEE